MQQQLAAGRCHYRTESGEPLPDPNRTPGAISPAVTQADLRQTVCRKGGYTKKIRPPASITNREKRLNAASYGYTGRLGDAEYDHLISLELGGDPNDPRDLWMEEPDPGHRPHGGVNNKKDPVEAQLHTAVPSGTAQTRGDHRDRRRRPGAGGPATPSPSSALVPPPPITPGPPQQAAPSPHDRRRRFTWRSLLSRRWHR
ncbi:hypothetical protein AB0950_35570 [Streptomyces sp. NPDC007189]|uniref:hypothetical protein n=1 Tax=Streptomyces sp. NPDC007189 TaxID=3154315 RepID=UPI003454402E